MPSRALLFSLLLLSPLAFASHTVSLSYRFGDLDYDLKPPGEPYSDEEGASHLYVGYRYGLNDNIAVGVAYLDGTTDSFLSGFTSLVGESVEIEYSQFRLEGEGTLPVSQRNYLFGQMNLSRFDYELLVDDQSTYEDDGFGYGAGVGWGYQFDSGLGLRLGAYYDRYDSNVEMVNLGWDLSYRF